MFRTVSFNVTSGMDSTVRVLTTLRRKQFDVKEFTMKEIDSKTSQLKVTLVDGQKLGLDNVILQMKKLVDVYDVVEM